MPILQICLIINYHFLSLKLFHVSPPLFQDLRAMPKTFVPKDLSKGLCSFEHVV